MDKKIKLNLDNYSKCLCPVCPVQGDVSVCTQAKKSQWSGMRKKAGEVLEEYPNDPSTYDIELDKLEEHELGLKHNFKTPTKNEMIELYCQIGISDCDDLNSEKSCVCPDCQVWQNHDLRSYKYCLNGNADEIG